MLDSGARDIDVVPVAIVGAGRILPRDGFKVRPGTVEVRFGTPIAVAGFAHRDRAALARRAEEGVAALLGLPAPPGPAAATVAASATAPNGRTD